MIEETVYVDELEITTVDEENVEDTILKLTPNSFIFNGEEIKDAGKAYEILMAVLTENYDAYV